MKTEDYWKILNGKCALPEALRILDYSADEIQEILEKSISMVFYFKVSLMIFTKAYERLNDAKEIDNTKIFSLATHSFDDNPNVADYGIDPKGLYMYTGKDWVLQ